MSKKKERKIRQAKLRDLRPAQLIKDFNIKRLKQEVVMRGMPFEEVAGASSPQMESYFIRHHDLIRRPELLDEYDDWLENYLRKERGIDDESILSPMLRLGYVGEEREDGTIKTKRIRGVRRTKKKKEKTKEGIYQGTKKAMVYELEAEGIEKKEVVKRVMKEFPDAKEKSIGIWYNKARRTRTK